MKRREGFQFMQGNEACVHGAIDVGAKFFAGYPITPSSEIAQLASEYLPQVEGVYLQMEDEIASMAAIAGASAAGRKAFTATSGPGFSLMQENLGFAIYGEIPCVIINVMRNGPSTGLATKPGQGDVMQARWGTHGDHPIIVLSPESVQECYDLTIRAFNLSEKYRIPVILLSDEVVGHMREKLYIPPVEEIRIVDRKLPEVEPEEYLPYQTGPDQIPAIPPFGPEYLVHISSSCHDETGYSHSAPQTADHLVRRLHQKIDQHREDIVQVEWFGPEEAATTIVAYGAVGRTAKEVVIAANNQGLSVNLLRLITLWPFPQEEIREALERSKSLIVPEMNLGQVFREIKSINDFATPIHSLGRIDGELITPQELMERLQEVYPNDSA